MPERTTHRVLTVVGLILALAMAALEATVVATVMPTVIGELGGIDYYAWVASAYLIATSVTVPIYGKLADSYGRKPIMLFGVAVFLLGSVASGASRTMTQLVAFRALQGIGAGAMQPIALTIVGDIFSLKERSRMQGAFGAAWGFFGLTGPLLGGLVVHYLSWRWVFYLNIPFGVASMVLVASGLVERIEKKRHELDFLGAGLLASAVVALQVATSGGSLPVAGTAAVLAVVLLLGFLAAERVAREPMLPLQLFRRRVIALSSVNGGIIGALMVTLLTYVPLHVQTTLHGTPTEGGSAIAPMIIAWPLTSAISGRFLPSVGFRTMIRLGFAIVALTALSLALFGTSESLAGLRVTSAAFGLGMGFANTALIIAVQTSVPWSERGIATASSMFFRNIGGVLGVAVVGGVLVAKLHGATDLPDGAATRFVSREGVRSLDPAVIARLSGILASGFGVGFWILAGMALTGALVSVWYPQVETEPGPAKGEKNEKRAPDAPIAVAASSASMLGSRGGAEQDRPCGGHGDTERATPSGIRN
jgi:EmrB/QacA subfamily drug resistance transporter